MTWIGRLFRWIAVALTGVARWGGGDAAPSRARTKPLAAGLLATVLLVAGCCELLAPDARFVNRRSFHPPFIYPALYQHVEQCVGCTGDYDRITWFLADTILDDNGHDHTGAWNRDHEITLLESEIWSKTPSHEMIHDLLGKKRGHKNWPKECETLPGDLLFDWPEG